jgi:hypothetical protein
MEALADVLAFAVGRITSLEKKPIGDYAGPTKALITNVGVIAWFGRWESRYAHHGTAR